MTKNIPLTLIAIKPATKLICVISVFYILTVLLIFCCDIVWFCKVPLSVIVIIYFRIYSQRHLFLTSSRAVISIWKTSDGFWSLQLANSRVLFANLRFPSFVTRYISILKFFTEERRIVFVILTPECVGKQEYSKLCSYLLHSTA